MATVTENLSQVKILDEAVYIPLGINALRKGINLSLLSLAMNK